MTLRNKKELSIFFDKEACRYDRILKGNLGVFYVNTVEQNIFFEGLHHLNGSNVLDIGIGTGRFINILSRNGFNVIGLDFSHEMLNQIQHGKIKLKLTLADGESLPFGDESIENIVCFRVFKYFQNPYKTFFEFCRVLKPSGHAIVQTPNKYSYQYFLTIYKSLGDRTYNDYLNLISYKKAKQFIKKAGFTIVDFKINVRIPFFIYSKVNTENILKILINIEKTLHKLFPCHLFARDFIFFLKKQ